MEGRRLRYDRALGATLGHPDGLHVNFVQVSADGSRDVLTYEAGVETCDRRDGARTAAGSTVCALSRLNLLPVRVRVLGGEFRIDVAQTDSMTMAGPAGGYMRLCALDVSLSPVTLIVRTGPIPLLR